MSPDAKVVVGIAIGALVLLAGVKAVSYFTGRKKAPGLRTVALLGDSMSAGPVYRRELEDMLGPGSTVEAFGYVGKQTPYILKKVGKALAVQPSDVVVLAGVNDLASGHSSERVIKNLHIIYTTLRSKGARVIGVTLTPWNERPQATMEINDWIRFASPADAIVNTAPMSDGHGNLHPDLDSGDGLHLNTQGQVALAMVVYNQGF
jgi:lysophospholipase L1-like esterase